VGVVWLMGEVLYKAASSSYLFKMKIIRFCYRKVIDASSAGAWEKLVHESTYAEFKMQVQLYNEGNKYKSFGEVLHHNPQAERLHFLVSAAATGYVQQLGGKIPNVLDNLGRHFLTFKQYRFEIINSDIEDKHKHQVAINFFSEPVQWHDTVGTYLLISPLHAEINGDGRQTHLLELMPFLSIYTLKEETNG
jgi:hypothetical protein